MSKNQVVLVGRLGQDPDVKEFEFGKIAQLNVATSESYKNNLGEWVEDTQWHKVVAKGKWAEFAAEHLAKGKEICLNGRLTYRSYEDKNKERKYVSEVVVSDLFMVARN